MKIYRVQGPDGRVHKIEGPDDASPAQIEAFANETLGSAPPPQGSPPESLATKVAGGGIEPLLALGSGAAAQIPAGLAGLAATLTKAVGLTDAEPNQVVNQVGGALTYKPRTQAGQDALGAISYPMEKYAQGTNRVGEFITDKTQSPQLAAGVKTLLDLAPGLLTMKASPNARVGAVGVAEAEALQRARNLAEVRDKSVSAGMDAGYKVPPSVLNPSATNKALESIAGKAAVKQEVTIGNQPITNELAVKELGLPADTALTPGKLKAFRETAAKPYNEVSMLSGTAASALREFKQAKAKANAQWDHYATSKLPEALDKAKQFSADAEVYQAVMEQEAAKAGKASLIPRLTEARKKIAQSYEIQEALNPGNAEVSAASIGRDLRGGDPLTGNLETIGRFQQAMRQYTGEGASTPTPGVSALGPVASVGMGMGGAGVGGPAGLLAGGLPLLRGPARNLLLSDWYQNMMARPQHGALNVMPTIQELILESLKRNRGGIAAGGLLTGAENQQ